MMSLLYFNWCILLVFKNIVIYVTSKFSLFWLSRGFGRSVGRSLFWLSRNVGRSVRRSIGRSVRRSLARSLFWLSRSVGRSVGPSVGRCSGCHAVSVGRSVAVC